MRSRLVAWGLIIAGLVLTAAWCALVVPALFVAEAGAGLTLGERALIAAPLAVGSGLLIVGGYRDNQKDVVSGRAAAAFNVAVMIGALAGLAAFLFLFMGD